jgi:hypothetical protein
MLLLRAEADRGAELAPQQHGLGVMISMVVRHQKVVHVAEPGAQLAQRRRQRRPRLGETPAWVDEDQVVAVHDGIGVDGGQPVVRQRQRNAVHTRRDLEKPWLSPFFSRTGRRHA